MKVSASVNYFEMGSQLGSAVGHGTELTPEQKMTMEAFSSGRACVLQRSD